jgi:hypothetical protein
LCPAGGGRGPPARTAEQGEEAIDDEQPKERISYPPEISLWHVIYQLVLACNSLYNKKTLGQKYVHIGNACTPPLIYERANARPDIKPLNIFLKEGIQNERPALKPSVLGDFGLYKILGADNVVTATGTPGFQIEASRRMPWSVLG